ncbi:MAG: hypothetical protein B6U87_02935 [Candidatus Aenigmarchaeota archaeon ex4484_52]|nr:MAG: hypothetical protein B6U87_02935 [Candidatus Aenigmarchaeota archaeon ex4484_52]
MNIYPAKMTEIEIFANKKNRENIIELLYDLGLLHLKKYNREIDFIDLAKPFANTEEITAMYLKLNSAINLVLEKTKIPDSFKKTDVDIYSFFPQVEEKIEKINKREKIKQQIIDTGIILNKAKELKKINVIDISVFSGLKNFVVYFVESKNNKEIAKELDKIKNTIYYSSDESQDTIIVCHKSDRQKVNELIAKHNAKNKDIWDLFELFKDANAKNIDKIIEFFENKKSQLENSITKLEQDALNFFIKNKDEIFSLNEILKEKVYKRQCALFFGESKNILYIAGWMPTAKLNILRQKIEKIKDICINTKNASEDAPVCLQHKKPAENYSMLLDFFCLPKLNTIDPSALLLITFPLIFGLIVGDMGYGLVMFIISLFLIKIKGCEQLSFILKTCGISCIIFGYIFAEFFGAESIFGIIHLHPYLHRVHQLNSLMLLCLGVGLLHVNFGFVLSAIKHFKHKNYLHLSGALSWILLQIGIGLIYFKYVYVGAILAILSIVLIYRAESIKGLIELPGLFGNILSYMRIMAVGLASVYLAIIINEQAFELIQGGTIGLIAGIFVLVLGHGFNTLLAILSPFIHTMRLHYVEFFTKFYDGGAEKYSPFGKD